MDIIYRVDREELYTSVALFGPKKKVFSMGWDRRYVLLEYEWLKLEFTGD